MRRNLGARHNSRAVIVALFIVLAVAAIWWVLTPPGIDDDRSPRVVRLEELKRQMNPNKNQKIALAPLLNADVFKVGAVFPLDGSMAMAYSTACDQVRTQATTLPITLSDKTTFGVSPELEVLSKGKINAKATRAVEYSVILKEVVLAPGEVELLNDLYNDADCLAAIANRDVLILFGLYRGSEAFGIKRAASGGFDLGLAVEALKEKLGISSEFSDEDAFSREDVTMYWALTKVRLDDPAFGGPSIPDEARLDIARELVTAESDYAQQAIPNTELAEPAQAEIDQVFDAILSREKK